MQEISDINATWRNRSYNDYKFLLLDRYKFHFNLALLCKQVLLLSILFLVFHISRLRFALHLEVDRPIINYNCMLLYISNSYFQGHLFLKHHILTTITAHSQALQSICLLSIVL